MKRNSDLANTIWPHLLIHTVYGSGLWLK